MLIKNPRTGIMQNCNDGGTGAPAVFLVHGWTANHMRWSRVRKLLEPHLRVVDLDLRGHGLSEKGSHLEYTFELYVEDLAGVMDFLGIEKAVLAGHSMGGMIIQHFALKYPERVEKLVLVGTASRVAESEKQKKKLKLGAWLFKHVFPLMIWIKDGKKKKDPDRFPDVFDPALRPTAKASGDSIRNMMNMDLREQLKGLHVPTLVFASEHDDTIPFHLGTEPARVIPGARLITFSGVDHHFQINKCEEIAHEVILFASK